MDALLRLSVVSTEIAQILVTVKTIAVGRSVNSRKPQRIAYLMLMEDGNGTSIASSGLHNSKRDSIRSKILVALKGDMRMNLILAYR